MNDMLQLVLDSVDQWLSYIDPTIFIFFKKFFIALLIGMLVGIERERKVGQNIIFAGVRTFAIASVSGMLGVYIALSHGILEILYLTMVFFILVAILVIYIKNVVYHQVGITGGITIFYVFLMGMLVAYDYYLFAIVGTIVITFLLIEKHTLSNFATHLTQDEIANAVQFLIIIFILIPITPDIEILGVINLKYILSIVIIVASISFLSFIFMKKIGPKQGIPLSGLIGGLVNSEATSGSLASMTKKKAVFLNVSYQGITLSNAAMLFRNLIIAFIVDPAGQVLVMMLPPQLLLIAANFALVEKEKRKHLENIEPLDIESPFAIKPAFKFGLGFTLLIITAYYLYAWFGERGVYTIALGGLISSAAVTASVGALAFSGSLAPTTAALIAVLASIFSTTNKILIVKMTGSDELVQKVTNNFIKLAAIGVVAFLMWIIIIFLGNL
jgi:uncharacterized membrane protein (DUF4010 family)